MTFLTHKSCSSISIYDFIMYASSGDLKHLVINYEAMPLSKVKMHCNNNKAKLVEVGDDISDEYNSLTFNKKELHRQKELAKMMYLEVQHNTIIKIINLYIETKDFSVLKTLEEFDMFFNEDDDIEKQIISAKKKATGLKMKLKIRSANFKEKYKVSAETKDKVSIKDLEKNLDAQALILESNLDKGYKIEPKETSVIRWVNMMEINERKQI
jgi:hypothetical protein